MIRIWWHVTGTDALRFDYSEAGLHSVEIDIASLDPATRHALQFCTCDRVPRDRYREAAPEDLILTKIVPRTATREALIEAVSAEYEAAVESYLRAHPDPRDLSRGVPWIHPALAEDPRIVAWIREHEDAIRRAVDALIARIRAETPPVGHEAWQHPHWSVRERVMRDPIVAEIWKRVRAEDGEKRRIEKAEAEAREQARKRAEEEQARRKRAQIAALIHDICDETDKARFADGLMPLDEAIEIIADHVLDPLAEIPIYERVEYDDLEHAGDCRAASIRCRVVDAESLSREAYSHLREIRSRAELGAKVFGAEPLVVAREHRCECSGCSAELTRCGALVRIAWSDFAVSREYALGEGKKISGKALSDD